jgi:hypothetical protein
LIGLENTVFKVPFLWTGKLLTQATKTKTTAEDQSFKLVKKPSGIPFELKSKTLRQLAIHQILKEIVSHQIVTRHAHTTYKTTRTPDL